MAELPQVDETRCTGCGDCVVVCPADCLGMIGPLPRLLRPITASVARCAFSSARTRRCAWSSLFPREP